MIKNSKQPAFPIAQDSAEMVDQGLTKLEYLAGMAMMGNLASPSTQAAALRLAEKAGASPTDFIAECSVQQAKALLDALERS